MTDNNDFRTQPMQQPAWPASEAPPSHYAALPVPGQVSDDGPLPVCTRDLLGTVRSTGTCFLLCIVTFGFYTLYWFYKTHEEMKRHTGTGLGGGLGLVLAFFISIVMYFLTPSEVGGMYERRGMRSPVSSVTWSLGAAARLVLLVGLIVWFVKVNGALNASNPALCRAPSDRATSAGGVSDYSCWSKRSCIGRTLSA